MPDAMAERTAAIFNLLESSNEVGFQPWADMYVNGHGEYWRAASKYVLQNQVIWEQILAQSCLHGTSPDASSSTENVPIPGNRNGAGL
jgi:hypothetical protein